MKEIWYFFQDEILGMKWLNRLIGSGLELLGLDISGRVGGSIQFFIYDIIKIMVLLGFLIFVISYIQSYFPPERTKKILGRFKWIWANMLAALLGNAKEAIENLGLSVEVEYITDMEKIMNYGVMSMPAIVINEKVVSMGKVLKVTDVEKLIHSLGF